MPFRSRFRSGTTTVTDCVIEDNHADQIAFGGGFHLFGGLLTLAGKTVVRGNNAYLGGGVQVEVGTLMIGSECSITRNTAAGGGIYNYLGTVILDGPDPSPIIVGNCPENCSSNTLNKCAPGGTCPS